MNKNLRYILKTFWPETITNEKLLRLTKEEKWELLKKEHMDRHGKHTH